MAMTMTTNPKYSLDNISEILFQGFDYNLPEETLKIISELALQVGSPDYVKTPVFLKRENPLKSDPSQKEGGGTNFKKNKRGKVTEITNDDDWNSGKTFQTTKIEEKNGFELQIDSIRAQLNKLTDKNYTDISNKIIEIINNLVDENIVVEDMTRLSSTIFDIASTNRFYSKIYADLFSDLSTKYTIMRDTFENNFNKFTELFDKIEYIDPKVNYDKFCEINKMNEKRKALAAFYLNLMVIGCIPKTKIIDITRNLLAQIYTYISQDDKKNEVDELTETIAILYKKELYDSEQDEKIDNLTINEVIIKIANSKVKDYKSLTNKSLFKFMDMIDM